MARAAYLKEIKPVQISSPASFDDAADQQPRTGREIMLSLFPEFGKPGLDQVEEAYVLRDVLTHNHLWEYTMRDDGTAQRRCCRH